MSRSTALLLSLSTLLSATPAPASPPPARHDDILVLGNRNPDQVRRDYVKEMALPSADDQLARFMAPVCPYVTGLHDPYNAMVVERLRKVAAASGMRVDSERCAPNAIVVVTPDKAKLLATWHAKAPGVFGQEMPEAQITALVRSSDPVAAWQILGVRGSDGRQLDQERLNRSGGGGDIADTTLMVPFALGSRYMNQIHYEFGASIVVIDAKAVAGADLRQLADFAAMQLFAHTDPLKAAKQPAPTILTLVQDAAAGRPSPLSLTEWDFAYLRSLYAYWDMYKAGAHRGDLAKRMAGYMAKDAHK